jgi:hypothetical protein
MRFITMRVTKASSLIGLLAPVALAKWSMVDEIAFRSAIDTNEQTLVACKLSTCASVFYPFPPPPSLPSLV